MKGSSQHQEHQEGSSKRFRLRIKGDSMKPAYRDGQWIEFVELDLKREAFRAGKDYYVELGDGTASILRKARQQTVKGMIQLPNGRWNPIRSAADTLVFRYVNRKYRVRVVVARRQIVRAGVAVAAIAPLEEEPPQLPQAAFLGRNSERAGLAAVA